MKLHFDSGGCRSGATEPAARKPQDRSRSSPSDRSSLFSTGRSCARRVLRLVERQVRNAQAQRRRRLGGRKRRKNRAENAEKIFSTDLDTVGTRRPTADRSDGRQDRHRTILPWNTATGVPKPGDRRHAREKAGCEKWMSGDFTVRVKSIFSD